MGNRSFYCDASDAWATPCCGVRLSGDIVENETVCPYCEETFTFDDDGEEFDAFNTTPTHHPPGSDEKIAVLQRRAERMEDLFHPEDRKDYKGIRSRVIPRYDNETGRKTA